MFLACFTQNKIAAMSAKILIHAKFQLGFVAGCSEKYISTNIIVPASPATPNSIVSNIFGNIVLFNLAICKKLTKIVIIINRIATIIGVKKSLIARVISITIEI